MPEEKAPENPEEEVQEQPQETEEKPDLPEDIDEREEQITVEEKLQEEIPEEGGEEAEEMDEAALLQEAISEFENLSAEFEESEDPIQKRIDDLYAKLEAERTPVQPNKTVDEEPETVEDLLALAEQRAFDRFQKAMDEREVQQREAEEKELQQREVADKALQKQVELLQEKNLVKTEEDLQGVLQQAFDLGGVDLFSAWEVWKLKQENAAYKEGASKKETVNKRKKMLGKVSKQGGKAGKIGKSKLNLREMDFDELADMATKS